LLRIVQQISKDVKSLKTAKVSQPAESKGQTDKSFDILSTAVKELLPHDKLEQIKAWVIEKYQKADAEKVISSISTVIHADPIPHTLSVHSLAPTGAKPRSSKTKTIQKKEPPLRVSKRQQGIKAQDGNESMMSLPPQSEGTFTNTEFLNTDTVNLPEPKIIDSTMSERARV